MSTSATRLYTFCHMETSLDGKIMGKYLWIEETNAETDSFYALFAGKDAYYHPQAMFNGRTTIEDNFTLYRKPALDENAAPVPAGDYLADDAKTGFYLIVPDSKGRIAWEEGKLKDFYGNKEAQVVEILPEAVSNAYKDYLRRHNVSYLLCGKEKIDLVLASQKIKEKLHVDQMMLGGGGAINWSFLQTGLCDEVSVVIAPAADGNPETQSLFIAREGLTTDQPIVFEHKATKLMDDGKLWLHYTVKRKSQHDFENDKEYQDVQKMLAEQKG